MREGAQARLQRGAGCPLPASCSQATAGLTLPVCIAPCPLPHTLIAHPLTEEGTLLISSQMGSISSTSGR